MLEMEETENRDKESEKTINKDSTKSSEGNKNEPKSTIQTDKQEHKQTKPPSPQSVPETSKPVAISVSDLEKQLTNNTRADSQNVNIPKQNIDNIPTTTTTTNDVMTEISKILGKTPGEKLAEEKNADDADLSMDHIKSLLDKLDDDVRCLFVFVYICFFGMMVHSRLQRQADLFVCAVSEYGSLQLIWTCSWCPGIDIMEQKSWVLIYRPQKNG